jgi:hypothetical protein
MAKGLSQDITESGSTLKQPSKANFMIVSVRLSVVENPLSPFKRRDFPMSFLPRASKSLRVSEDPPNGPKSGFAASNIEYLFTSRIPKFTTSGLDDEGPAWAHASFGPLYRHEKGMTWESGIFEITSRLRPSRNQEAQKVPLHFKLRIVIRKSGPNRLAMFAVISFGPDSHAPILNILLRLIRIFLPLALFGLWFHHAAPPERPFPLSFASTGIGGPDIQMIVFSLSCRGCRAVGFINSILPHVSTAGATGDLALRLK